MKIRQGFVSNSSSSSFVCNTNLSIDEVKEKLKSLLEFYNEFCKEDLEFDKIFGFIGLSQDKCEDSDYYTDEIGKDKFVICSKNDNSIPYELWDFIEKKFDAFRVHHG